MFQGATGSADSSSNSLKQDAKRLRYDEHMQSSSSGGETLVQNSSDAATAEMSCSRAVGEVEEEGEVSEPVAASSPAPMPSSVGDSQPKAESNIMTTILQISIKEEKVKLSALFVICLCLYDSNSNCLNIRELL